MKNVKDLIKNFLIDVELIFINIQLYFYEQKLDKMRKDKGIKLQLPGGRVLTIGRRI